jgi:hypothetical protein
MILALPLLAFGQTAAERDVLKAEGDRFAAMVAADADALNLLVGPELTYIHSSGGTMDKATWVESIRVGKSSYAAFAGDDQHVRVIGSTAIVVGVATVTPKRNGQPGTVFKIRYTAVHVNRNSRWQLVSFQATRLGE